MNIRLLVTSSLIGASLIACGGGGSTPSPTTSSTTASNVQASVSTSAQTSDSAFTPAVSPSVLSSLSLASAPTVTLPVTISGNGSAAISNALPTGLTTFSANGPIVLSHHRVIQSTVTGATPLLYFSYTPETNVTIPSGKGITCSFTLAKTPSDFVNYHVAYYNGSAWIADKTHVASISGDTITLSDTLSKSLTLKGGTTYGLVVYSLPRALDSATPMPTTAPTAAATSSPSVTPSPSVSATPTPSATTSSTVASGSVVVNAAVSGTSTTSARIFGSDSATISIPAAQSSGTISYSLTQAVPVNSDNVPALSGTGVHTVLGYAKILPSKNFVWPTGSQFSASLSVPSVTPSGSYHIAVYAQGDTASGTKWLTGYGTSTISGTTATINLITQSYEIVAPSSSYNTYLALYD